MDNDPGLLLLRTNALNDLAYISMYANDLIHAEESVQKAIGLLEGHTGFQPHGFAYTKASLMDTYAQVLLQTGSLEEASDAVDIALGICLEQENNPQCSLGTAELLLIRLTKAKIDLVKGEDEKARSAVRTIADELDRLDEISESQRRVANCELSWFDEHLRGWRSR